MHNTKGVLAMIVSLGLALALLLPLSIIGANGPTVTVGIDAPAEVGVGSSFVANVTVSYVENFDTCGFDVTYNQTIIHVTDVTGGQIDGHAISVASGDWYFIPSGGGDTGRIRVAATSSVSPTICGTNGTGYIAQIHFTAVGSGGKCSNIALEAVGMYACVPPPLGSSISTTTQGDSVCLGGGPQPPVGGTAYPPDKLLMVLPWIALGAAIIVATSLVVRRRRSATR
jgi:hypothetical protein